MYVVKPETIATDHCVIKVKMMMITDMITLIWLAYEAYLGKNSALSLYN